MAVAGRNQLCPPDSTGMHYWNYVGGKRRIVLTYCGVHVDLPLGTLSVCEILFVTVVGLGFAKHCAGGPSTISTLG